jgi:hypothetical protein
MTQGRALTSCQVDLSASWHFDSWHFDSWHFDSWHFDSWHFDSWHFDSWHFVSWPFLLVSKQIEPKMHPRAPRKSFSILVSKTVLELWKQMFERIKRYIFSFSPLSTCGGWIRTQELRIIRQLVHQLPKWITLQVLHSRVGSWPHLQTLD